MTYRALAVLAAALAPLPGCGITETGFSCIKNCVAICGDTSGPAFFSAEVLARDGDRGRVRLIDRLGGTAEVDFAPGDEVDHGGLWLQVEAGDRVIVSIAAGDAEPLSGGGFPLDGGGENVLCSDDNPQDPPIPLPVVDYMSLSGGAEECEAALADREIPIDCEDTP